MIKEKQNKAGSANLEKVKNYAKYVNDALFPTVSEKKKEQMAKLIESLKPTKPKWIHSPDKKSERSFSRLNLKPPLAKPKLN